MGHEGSQDAERCPWAQVSAWCQPMPVPQSYCQKTYRGQLASVHSKARNEELQKLAKTYNRVISPWIGAVTSYRVRGHQGQRAAGCWQDQLGAALRGAGLGLGCWGWWLGFEA